MPLPFFVLFNVCKLKYDLFTFSWKCLDCKYILYFSISLICTLILLSIVPHMVVVSYEIVFQRFGEHLTTMILLSMDSHVVCYLHCPSGLCCCLWSADWLTAARSLLLYTIALSLYIAKISATYVTIKLFGKNPTYERPKLFFRGGGANAITVHFLRLPSIGASILKITGPIFGLHLLKRNENSHLPFKKSSSSNIKWLEDRFCPAKCLQLGRQWEDFEDTEKQKIIYKWILNRKKSMKLKFYYWGKLTIARLLMRCSTTIAWATSHYKTIIQRSGET